MLVGKNKKKMDSSEYHEPKKFFPRVVASSVQNILMYVSQRGLLVANDGRICQL
jgi:hypothetical protein